MNIQVTKIKSDTVRQEINELPKIDNLPKIETNNPEIIELPKIEFEPKIENDNIENNINDFENDNNDFEKEIIVEKPRCSIFGKINNNNYDEKKPMNKIKIIVFLMV